MEMECFSCRNNINLEQHGDNLYCIECLNKGKCFENNHCCKCNEKNITNHVKENFNTYCNHCYEEIISTDNNECYTCHMSDNLERIEINIFDDDEYSKYSEYRFYCSRCATKEFGRKCNICNIYHVDYVSKYKCPYWLSKQPNATNTKYCEICDTYVPPHYEHCDFCGDCGEPNRPH
jgi:hypothetical protein